MTITFYKTADNPKKVDKTANLVTVGQGVALAPTGQVDVLNPVILTDYAESFLNSNYAYIDTFHRYYWITTAVDTAGRLIVSCKVDYLTSWAGAIKNCPATIVRAQLSGPTYVIDNKLPVDPSQIKTHGIDFPQTPISFNNGLVTPQYIMITR